MATVRTVTLPDGSTFTMSDWGDYPIWSRAEFDPANAQDVTIFNYLVSQQIPGGATAARATLLDTNVPAAGQLPLRHQMVIFSVMARYDEANTSDDANDNPLRGKIINEPTNPIGLNKWNTIQANLFFQFIVEQSKPYIEGTLNRFPAGGGVHWQEAGRDVATVESYYVTNGEVGMHAARRLAMPIHLGALETFNGVFKFPRGALPNWVTGFATSDQTAFGVTMILNGPRQRPVG